MGVRRMSERITTLNSTYEVDWDNNRIRRLTGVNEPTPNQSADGEWQQARSLHVTDFGGGQIVYMIWDDDRATISSLIQSRDSA